MFVTILAALAATAAPPSFEFKDGDRVVWIGSTHVEREQRYGYWETAVLAAFPDKNITFRNLGWSGDTVWGESRAAFDPPAKGYERLVKLTLDLKPTVIVICYGTNESFAGTSGLEAFQNQYKKLIEDLKPAKARLTVLMSPPPFPVGPILGNAKPDPRNVNLNEYTIAIRYLARDHGCQFANLFNNVSAVDFDRLTDNRTHYNEAGYRDTMQGVRNALGLPNEPRPVPALEAIRQAVIAKNQLFFYKWRPQNETYLTGFRKHEQGKNAAEIVQFDPLIAAAEKQIRAELAKLKK